MLKFKLLAIESGYVSTDREGSHRFESDERAFVHDGDIEVIIDGDLGHFLGSVVGLKNGLDGAYFLGSQIESGLKSGFVLVVKSSDDISSDGVDNSFRFLKVDVLFSEAGSFGSEEQVGVGISFVAQKEVVLLKNSVGDIQNGNQTESEFIVGSNSSVSPLPVGLFLLKSNSDPVLRGAMFRDMSATGFQDDVFQLLGRVETTKPIELLLIPFLYSIIIAELDVIT